MTDSTSLWLLGLRAFACDTLRYAMGICMLRVPVRAFRNGQPYCDSESAASCPGALSLAYGVVPWGIMGRLPHVPVKVLL